MPSQIGNPGYIVMDPGQLSFPLTPQAIRMICDRHTGVGPDGILTPVPSSRGDFGLRIFARYLHDHGLDPDEVRELRYFEPGLLPESISPPDRPVLRRHASGHS